MARAWENLFLYGTLLEGQADELRCLVEDATEPLGPARLAGRVYGVGDYPAAVAEAASTSFVSGVLRAVDPAARRFLFNVLDDYEGIGGVGEHAGEFARRALAVLDEDDCLRRAWVYVYRRDPSGLFLIEDGDWLAHLRRSRAAGG